MQVRLGFAVATTLIKPDVLLLDEVLAVGDESFRSKCYQAVGDMLQQCAVIFVSHSMPMIYRLSTRVMVLASGEAVFSGDPTQAIEVYFRSIEAHRPGRSPLPGNRRGHDPSLLSLKTNMAEARP